MRILFAINIAATTTNNGEVVSAEVSAALSHPDLFTLEVVKGQQTLKANQFMSDDNGKLVVRVVPNDIDTIALGTNYTLTFTMAEDTSKHQIYNKINDKYEDSEKAAQDVRDRIAAIEDWTSVAEPSSLSLYTIRSKFRSPVTFRFARALPLPSTVTCRVVSATLKAKPYI